jgi:hypothetical protein
LLSPGRAGRCSERSAEFASVNPFLCSLARARLGGAMPNEGNKATGKPAAPAKPFTKSPVPAGVYAPAIGLCRDLSDCEDKLLGLLYS